MAKKIYLIHIHMTVPVIANDSDEALEEAKLAVIEEVHNSNTDFYVQEILRDDQLGTIFSSCIPWGSIDDRTCADYLKEWHNFVEVEKQSLMSP